ncbi:MAG: mechanosensitive ion channel [Nitrospirae bacterium]|nr:mechanosensitive ion channel [Nitrospirota bacterium]
MMPPIENLIKDFLMSIGVILLMGIAGYGIFYLVRKIFSRYIEPRSIDKIRTPFIALVILFGAYVAFHRLGVRDHILYIVDSIFFILGTLFSVKIGYDLMNMTINWYTEEIAFRAHIPLDEKFLPLIDVTVKIFVTLIGIAVIMGHFNYSFGSVIAAMGLGSLAIGLAAKDTLANMISGFIIMIDRPFKLNDRIKLASGKIGNVISIGLRSVRLKDQENNVIIIPNTELVNMQLVNMSQPDSKMRHQIRIDLALGTDVEKARGILTASANRVQWVIKEPPPDVLFSGMGKLGLSLTLRFFVEADQLERAVDGVNTEISKRFSDEKVELSQRLILSPPARSSSASGGGIDTVLERTSMPFKKIGTPP